MPSPFKILLIDDDPLIHESVDLVLPKTWHIRHVRSPEEVNHFDFHAALVDVHLGPDPKKADGLNIIRRLHEKNPQTEIVAISGDLNSEILEKCLQNGAFRFLPKPIAQEELALTLDKIEALWLLRDTSFRSKNSRIAWVGQSQTSQNVRRQIAQLKGEDGPILIEGESGTGKEVVAQLLHDQETLRPWVQINAAAIPAQLFESEMFGHVRGAFTGAQQNKMGLAEAAHGGDLFIDEIEALPLDQQAKLLRFLETGEVRRIGASNTTKVRCRVIAATNKNLLAMVKQGLFREDLYWRICGKKILLPALRERSQDIAELVQYFLDLEKPRYNKSVSPEATDVLKNYSWPGNVRELKRVCEQLCLLSPLPIIRAIDVTQVIMPSPVDKVFAVPDFSLGLQALVEQYEAQVIQSALVTTDDIESLAKTLKISRSSLYKKIKDYNIQNLN